MTCRKTKAAFYRFFALVAFITVSVLSWIALSFTFAEKAYAATGSEHDTVFGANHASATSISSAAELVSADYTLPSGTYHLTKDIVLTESVQLFQEENIKLCLHGHSLTISGDQVFRVYSNATLGIYDCSDADNCGSISGRGIYIMGGTVNMYGGAIKDVSGGYGVGGGITVCGGGTFNMYNGVIKDNRANGNGGGGVDVGSSGTFNMYGGTISNNRVTHSDGGAGVLVAGATSTFHMYGGSIINNVIDYGSGKDEETLSKFYNGAGVYVWGGTFTIEGDVNISGNVRGNSDSQTVNNVGLLRNDTYDGKIGITGKLGDNARIGVTAPVGVLTNGYYAAGNTENPSEYFISDDGLSIGFDDTRKECAVLDSSDTGDYNMVDAVVTGTSTATVGDADVTFTLEVTLKTADNSSTKKITDIMKVEIESPLHGGVNTVSFVYKYNGVSGEQTKQISYDVEPMKKHTNVTWVCSGATADGSNSAKRDYDGTDILSLVTATYTGYDGVSRHVSGSWATDDIIVTDEAGNSVSSAAGVGVYKFYLSPSDDYLFDNNMFTVKVIGDAGDGYYQMQDAAVVGVAGTQTVGDTTVTVIIERSLKHTKDLSEKTDRVNYVVTLDNALVLGDNTVAFEYKYNDMGGGVQTKQLSVTVTADKKTVTVAWYFYDSFAEHNTATHVYDGADASAEIVAVYDGIDGNPQSVSGASPLMLKTNGSGSTATSLSGVGVYTLSLAPSADYTFENNAFTYTVVESLSDIAELVYQESGKMVLGVSCAGGFENGTQLSVERTEYNSNVIDGDVNTALNVKFVKDSVQITPTGEVTVYVLIPDELRNVSNYKIYNISNGVATEVQYAKEGNYAVFESDDLSCILFVTPKNTPPITGPNSESDDGGILFGFKSDSNALMLLWILLAVVAVGIAAFIIVKNNLSKRNRTSATTGEEYNSEQAQDKPEQKSAQYCPYCGCRNDGDSTFCQQCGKKLD